jgi:hypothetical protein
MYQVLIVSRPANWTARGADDLPSPIEGPFEVASESQDLLEAQGRVVAYNQDPARNADRRWAVVADPSARSRLWAGPRLCTPLVYKVVPLVRPEGWEPSGPADVPNCLGKAESRGPRAELSYQQALDTMWALNQQGMDHDSSTWFVPVAVENEPLEESVKYDPAGMETVVQVRRLHLVRPPRGGRGDCSYCPARDFPCRDEQHPDVLEPEVTRRQPLPAPSREG